MIHLDRLTVRSGTFTLADISLDIPSGQDEAIEFTLTKRMENFHTRSIYLVDIQPYTGVIMREGFCDQFSTSFVHWVMYFHDSFQWGKIGMGIVALASLTIFFSMITGLLFYGKRIAGVLMLRLPLKGIHFYRSLHLYVGVWTLLLTMTVFFTGFWMVRGVFTADAWTLDEPRQKIHLSISLDSCLARSRAMLPGFIPDFVDLPLMEGDMIGIDGNIEGSSRIMRGDASHVVFDPRTGVVVDARDNSKTPFPQNLTAAFWPLHIGNYGGALVRILYVIGGLMPGILAISGFVMWRKSR